MTLPHVPGITWPADLVRQVVNAPGNRILAFPDAPADWLVTQHFALHGTFTGVIGVSSSDAATARQAVQDLLALPRMEVVFSHTEVFDEDLPGRAAYKVGGWTVRVAPAWLCPALAGCPTIPAAARRNVSAIPADNAP